MVPDDRRRLLMADDLTDLQQLEARDEDVPDQDHKVEKKIDVEDHGPDGGIEMPEVFCEVDGQEENKQQGNTINSSSNQLILIIFTNKLIEFAY
jgi:hypothetical protein